ncbi:hypothetical protein MCAP1_000663 [Malassezia caprae]|uniref:Uncharacterized protein n=1 Tax=Malassezia caprae TaxID=1381934 RepID=A0AAF0IYQ7_9BASI|nr:hypothetical protein MCAP1_000663 [Malassezia caprae]
MVAAATATSSLEVTATDTSKALAIRAECNEGGEVFNEIANAVIKVLPLLQPILMAAGVGEVVPFVVTALKVIEMLHLFC